MKANRPKISIYIASSIDGYIARKDGSIDWLERVHDVCEDYGFKEHFNSIDCLVLGRGTYDVVAGFPEWPYKGKRVIVLSTSLQSTKNEAELYRGDLMQLALQLHADGVKHVWIDGGVTVSNFLRSELVDAMTITIIPTILGSGILLFNEINKELICNLQSAKSYPSGLVQLRYELTHN